MVSNLQWVRVSDEAESWHIVKSVQYPNGGGAKIHTLCGRTPNEEDASAIVDDRPETEKTCESCLRIEVSG